MKRVPVVTAISISLLCAGIAWACNVPVFRFALERWRPDSYRAVLFHRGDLTDAQREQILPLEEQQEQSLSNLAFRTVDVSQLDDAAEESVADRALLAALGDAEFPMLVVQYPAHLNIQKPVWSGLPDREAIRSLVDSPARQELIRRLAEGQTAVWLFLESGQKEPDDAEVLLVEEKLKALEHELELPELTDAPEDAIAANAPLKIEFSLLRVRRDDPAEQALVAMLLGSEPDLAERTDPMVFPVYGRGRALWALIGAGITAKNVADSAGFLVGPCSCEVKELNPGFDLLLAADWDVLLAAGGEPLATAATPSSAQPTVAELVPIPTGAQPVPAPTPTAVTYPAPVVVEHSYLPTNLVGRKVWIVGGVVLAGLLVVLVAVALSQTRRGDAQA